MAGEAGGEARGLGRLRRVLLPIELISGGISIVETAVKVDRATLSSVFEAFLAYLGLVVVSAAAAGFVGLIVWHLVLKQPMARGVLGVPEIFAIAVAAIVASVADFEDVVGNETFLVFGFLSLVFVGFLLIWRQADRETRRARPPSGSDRDEEESVP